MIGLLLDSHWTSIDCGSCIGSGVSSGIGLNLHCLSGDLDCSLGSIDVDISINLLGCFSGLVSHTILLSLKCHLSIQVGGVCSLVAVVDCPQVIFIVGVLLSERLSHLSCFIVVSVYWWWLKTCWVSWVNLGVSIAWVWSLVAIVDCPQVVAIVGILFGERLSHLSFFIIVSINGWWLKSSWVSWVDGSQSSHVLKRIIKSSGISSLPFLIEVVLRSWTLVWVIVMHDIILIISVLID